MKANIEAVHAAATVLMPGKFLADAIPIRACIYASERPSTTNPLVVRYIPDWFPGTRYKLLAKEAREKFKISINGPLEYVKNAMQVSIRNILRYGRVLSPSVTTSPAR